MNLKQKLLALALASTAATSALAEIEALSVAAVNAFNAEDVASLFEPQDNTKPLQVAVLSEQEMKTTEGAWVNYAIGGFAGGLYNGISYYGSTPNRTVGGWTTAIGTGVVGGAVGAIPWWSAPIWGGGIALTGGWAASRYDGCIHCIRYVAFSFDRTPVG